MEFRVQAHRLSTLTARFNLMVALVLGLLISNGLLIGFAIYLTLHQKTEITPFIGNPSYIKSEALIDSHYLDLMSENFIYLRLNVTPETVSDNHQRLLSFVDAEGYQSFLAQLKKEAAVIQDKKISSHFEIASIHSDANALQTIIHGTLKRTVVFRALEDTPMSYTLHYHYSLGRLTVMQFIHTEESHHAS